MEAVDSHRHGLEPFFNVVSFTVVELTAQFVAGEDSQVACTIDKELRVSDIMFLGQSVQERRRGKDPTAAVHIDL